jgi:hypothetical protein
MQQLPPALAGLAAFRQFLLYKVVPGFPKPRKIPVHPHTLAAVDAHDPGAWVDAAQACALATALGEPYGVAFSIQRGNGLFFVDIDSALTADGWSPLAVELCARFPGAAVEVSQSGTGLHILGRGTAPSHACKDTQRNIECYTEGRFVALTGLHATGDVSSDHTAALTSLVATYFQPRAGDGALAADWSNAPRPEWRGPVDDAELIRRAMQSRGAGAIFGGKAAFADLWQANVDVLAVSYPDPDRGYDASSADMALAQHLAFWTGCDCERIERLMRQSALVRGKWERTDYLPMTITAAVSRQRDVLQDRLPEPVAATPPAAESQSPQAVTGDTFLGPAAQIEFFKGCTYVFESHRVLVPGGYLLKPDPFRVRYGGYTFTMDNLNQRTSRDAWEAFTQSQAFRAPRADRTCFRPDLAPGAIINEGSRTLVNLWWPAGVRRLRGDATPFLRHLELTLPDKRDRIILLSYMAACVQHQGVKFQWCPLLQGAEGNGKTLFTRCVAEAVGQRYTHWARAERINAQFNGWLCNKTFVGVEDIYVPEARREVWETLKPMITGDLQEVESKGVDQDTRNVVANFMINSNHRNAVRKTRNDRRLAVFYTAQQSAEDVERDMGGDYFAALYAWLKADGYAIVAELLYTYPIAPDFNPAGACQRAPRTSTTDEVFEATMGGVEHEVLEAIAQGTSGFKGGWISSMALDQLLVRTRMDARIPRNARKELLEGMGYVWHPGLTNGRVNNDVMPDAGKPRLFVQRSHPHWGMTGAADIARAYTAAQG